MVSLMGNDATVLPSSSRSTLPAYSPGGTVGGSCTSTHINTEELRAGADDEFVASAGFRKTLSGTVPLSVASGTSARGSCREAASNPVCRTNAAWFVSTGIGSTWYALKLCGEIVDGPNFSGFRRSAYCRLSFGLISGKSLSWIAKSTVSFRAARSSMGAFDATALRGSSKDALCNRRDSASPDFRAASSPLPPPPPPGRTAALVLSAVSSLSSLDPQPTSSRHSAATAGARANGMSRGCFIVQTALSRPPPSAGRGQRESYVRVQTIPPPTLHIRCAGGRRLPHSSSIDDRRDRCRPVAAVANSRHKVPPTT